MNIRNLDIHLHRTVSALLFTLAALAPLAGCDLDEADEADELALDEEEEDMDEGFRGANDYNDPVGTHDLANCSTIAGWARDGDTTAATQVHIYKDAPAPNGEIVTHVIANLYRGDLPFADKNHGFSIATPAAFKTGCPETIYIHAIDLDAYGNIVPGGNNKLLGSTGKTVTCGPRPPEGCGGIGPKPEYPY